MALVSPYDTALIHEFSRREAARLLTSFSQANPSSNTRSADNSLDTFFASLPEDRNATKGVDDDVPSVHACAVHLELLETFMALRRKVLNSNALDVTFGISHNPKERPSLAKRREEKWDKFVNLSVARFAIWIDHIHKDSKAVQQLSSPLPPLDILMVLHAFMMNPAYDTWSDRGFAAAMRTWSFPWKLIVS